MSFLLSIKFQKACWKAIFFFCDPDVFASAYTKIQKHNATINFHLTSNISDIFCSFFEVRVTKYVVMIDIGSKKKVLLWSLMWRGILTLTISKKKKSLNFTIFYLFYLMYILKIIRFIFELYLRQKVAWKTEIIWILLSKTSIKRPP